MMLFKQEDLRDAPPAFSQSAAPLPDALEIYHDVIDDVLRMRGVDAVQAYKPESGLWIIPAQPAPVVLRVKPADEENDDVDYIESVMRLGPLPAQNLLAFYRALLESNMRLSNAAFAVDGEGVFLRLQRPLAGLDEDELNDIISSLINAAAAEFNDLLEQFVFGASILR
jgi:hypothetical protein